MGGEVILVLPYGFDFSLSNFQRYFEMYPYSIFLDRLRIPPPIFECRKDSQHAYQNSNIPDVLISLIVA